MRKILFRAKGTDERDKNHWYEGYYYFNSDTTYCFSEDYEKAAKDGNDPRHHYILFDQATDWGLPNRHLRADIKPETLCEYIGKADMRHAPIFEHDFIRVKIPNAPYERDTYIVEYDNESAAFICRQGKLIIGFSTFPAGTTFEVIGNSIDNPELFDILPEFKDQRGGVLQ